MKNIKCFENFDNDIQEDVYEKQFIEKFPEIRKMKLKKVDGEYHFYSDNIDIYIEKKDIDFDINSIIGNSTNLEYVDFINYIEKYAVFLNRMNEPLTEVQFVRLVNLKGLKTLKMIIVDLHNEQVYYEKLANTFLTINKFIEKNNKK